MKKGTYIDTLKNNLVPMQELLALLEKQIEYIDIDVKSKTRTPREVNSDKILRIKTLQEIDTLKKILHEKEQYYIMYAKKFEQDLDEANKKFDTVLKKAWKVARTNPKLMELMKKAKFEEAETNDESKVIMYNKLKQFV